MNLKNIFKKGDATDTKNQKMTIRSIDEMVKKETRISDREFKDGYNIIKKYPRSVSILGSAVLTAENDWYKKAEVLAGRIARELKYAVVTGGGPGIMEAANKGAFEAGGDSIGFAIKLPNEQFTNKYLTESIAFEYFFTRKTLLFFSAEAYIYYPGGFGTMDELFEILTLIKTDKIPQVPVILIDRSFWQPLLDFIEKELYEDVKVIKKDYMNIYRIVDSDDEVLEIIKNAPLRTDY